MKMENRITNTDVQEFLKDVKDRGETIILEEGKQKDELLESARKRGIIISKNDRDLGVIKTIYGFTSKANSNKARLPQKEFVKIFPQIVGRPMNYAHDRKRILGFYIDYKYILKDEKAITYAIFFKSAYPNLWKKAKDFQKKKKLSSSYEIWNDEKKIEYLSDGTYVIHELGMAGGALIFEEYGEKPAFKDAKVLSIASKQVKEYIDGKCLEYASKYNPKEIITAEKDYFREEVEKNLERLNKEKKTKETEKVQVKPEEKKEEPKTLKPKKEEKKEVKVDDKKPAEKPKEIKKEVITEPKLEEKKKEEVKKPEPKVEEKPKIKCSNCSEEFEHIILPDVKIETTINCPKCKAILKQDGTMIYPPQIIDFSVACPSCKTDRWLLMARNDKEAQVRCSCKKEYKITFSDKKTNELLDKTQFSYSGSVNCPQCGKWIYYEGISGVTYRSKKCPKCGLEFSFDISKIKERTKISKIEEIEVKKVEKSSEQGGKKAMEFKIETGKYHRFVDDFDKLEATLSDDYGESTEIEVAKRLTTEQRKALPDNMFAVVVRVKDKRTGKMRKIRKYPINDEAHVRNALARLGQSAPQATLRRLGVPIEKVRAKILRRARQLNMTTLLERYKKAKVEKKVEAKKEQPKVKESPKAEVKESKAKETPKTEEKALPISDGTSKIVENKVKATVEESKAGLYKAGINKLVSQVVSLKKEMAKIKVEMGKKIDFYKENAVEINKRREELGEFAKDLTDEQILNDDKFEKAQLEKENVELKSSVEKSSERVGLKKKDDNYYAKKQREVNDVAFPKRKE